MQDLTAKLQAAEEDCKEHAARVQEAEDKLAQHNNKLNSHLEAKEVQDREAMEKLEQASKVHNGFEDRIAAMSEGQSAGMQQLSESLEVAQQEARALQTKVEGLEKQCRDLESRKSAMERERDEIERKLELGEQDMAKANEDLDIHKQEVTSLRARMYELDQAQSLVQQLRSEVSMHKIERDGLQQQLDASNIGFRQLRQVRLVVVPSVPDTVGLLNLPCYILGMTLSWSGAGQ